MSRNVHTKIVCGGGIVSLSVWMFKMLEFWRRGGLQTSEIVAILINAAI